MEKKTLPNRHYSEPACRVLTFTRQEPVCTSGSSFEDYTVDDRSDYFSNP